MNCRIKLKLFVMRRESFGRIPDDLRKWLREMLAGLTGKLRNTRFRKKIFCKVKLADKPGSVVDSHSSRRFVT